VLSRVIQIDRPHGVLFLSAFNARLDPAMTGTRRMNSPNFPRCEPDAFKVALLNLQKRKRQ